MVGQEQGSAAKITFACASPFAVRIWPLAHGDLDDVAQRRRVAEHLVQDTDAFGDAEIKASKCTYVGGGIENAFSLGTPQHDVDGTFDAGDLGYFSSAEEAHAEYCRAAKETFGEYWRAA